MALQRTVVVLSVFVGIMIVLFCFLNYPVSNIRLTVQRQMTGPILGLQNEENRTRSPPSPATFSVHNRRPQTVHRKVDESMFEHPNGNNSTGAKARPDIFSTSATSLFLVAYHRTGSTFVASIFDAYPNSFYIFEPLFYVTTEGHQLRFFNGATITVTKGNKQQLVMDTLTNLAKCDLININTYVFFAHSRFIFNPVFKKFHNCLSEKIKQIKLELLSLNGTAYSSNDLKHLNTIRGTATYISENLFMTNILQMNNVSTKTRTALLSAERSCVEPVRTACIKADLRVFKFIRITVQDLEGLLPTFPGLKIVHLIRDPRGNVLSQKMQISGNIQNIASYYCSSVSRDVDTVRRFDILYPNRTYTLRYENLSTQPLLEAGKVFEFLGLNLKEKVRTFLNLVALGSTGKTKNDCIKKASSSYCVHRADASKIAHSWRWTIKENELEVIQKFCREAMTKLGIIPVVYSDLKSQLLQPTGPNGAIQNKSNDKINTTVI